MAIRMTNHAPGMTAEIYDAVMRETAPHLRAAPGFVAHAAQVTAGGVTVTEVWRSESEWRSWFDASVRPHLPPGAPDPEVAELHNALP